MKSNRRNKHPKFINLTIALPIGTLAIVGSMLFLLSTYESNWTFNWNEIRPEIRDTVKLIENYGSVTSSVVGINAKTPQQWHRRKWLMRNADEKELRLLIDYPDGVIKATAFEGLIRKPNSRKYELITQALNDTTTFFDYRSGCLGFPMMLGEYVVENIIPVSDKMPPLSPNQILRYNLSKEEIANIIELYNRRIDKKKIFSG